MPKGDAVLLRTRTEVGVGVAAEGIRSEQSAYEISVGGVHRRQVTYIISKNHAEFAVGKNAIGYN